MKPMFWRPSRRLLLGLLAIALAGAAREAVELASAERWNRQIATATATPSGDAPPEVRFARAVELAAAGDLQAALATYRTISEDESPELAIAARYNSGNLLLAQALALDARAPGGAKSPPGQRIPLIELAKESYREVLRADPGHWDARYNLERAQRLLPDPDPGEEVANDPRPGAERAVTTMRGYSPGLP